MEITTNLNKVLDNPFAYTGKDLDDSFQDMTEKVLKYTGPYNLEGDGSYFITSAKGEYIEDFNFINRLHSLDISYDNFTYVNKVINYWNNLYLLKEKNTMTAKEWVDMMEKISNENTNNNNNIWYSYEETTTPVTEKVESGNIFTDEEIYFINKIFNKSYINETDLVSWLKEVSIIPNMNHDKLYACLYGKIKCYFHEVIVRLGTPNQEKRPSVGIGIEATDFSMNPDRNNNVNFICESEDSYLKEPCQKLEEAMRMAQSFGWQFNLKGNVKTGEVSVLPVESSINIKY